MSFEIRKFGIFKIRFVRVISLYPPLHPDAPGLFYPFTVGKKYEIVDRTPTGFAIKDDTGVPRSFLWGHSCFKYLTR